MENKKGVKRVHKWFLHNRALFPGWVRIDVFPDHESFAKAARALDPNLAPKTIGVCFSTWGRKNYRLRGSHVMLDMTCLGSGYVAHELQHAALWLCRDILPRVLHKHYTSRGPLRKATPEEEKLCDVVEFLTREFWRKYYRYTGSRVPASRISASRVPRRRLVNGK